MTDIRLFNSTYGWFSLSTRYSDIQRKVASHKNLYIEQTMDHYLTNDGNVLIVVRDKDNCNLRENVLFVVLFTGDMKKILCIDLCGIPVDMIRVDNHTYSLSQFNGKFWHNRKLEVYCSLKGRAVNPNVVHTECNLPMTNAGLICSGNCPYISRESYVVNLPDSTAVVKYSRGCNKLVVLERAEIC